MIDARRRALLAALSTGLAGCLPFTAEGLRNECRAEDFPALAAHPLVQAAWAGIDPADVWDAHVHLVGLGDSGSGMFVSPRMRSLANPMLYAQFRFYMNAGCVSDADGRIDLAYLDRLRRLVAAMPAGFKAVLFAFDGVVGADGDERPDATMLRTPDEHVAQVARAHPGAFEWVASVHPWRTDAIERLERAARLGARAVKWLPNAMGIDPASPRCDAFYAALVRLGLPLITHAGHEAAVHAPEGQALGNPLRLRRPLEHGVRVVVAHCATLGEDVDLDRGATGPRVPSFALFERLMDEPRWAGRLFGDLSAVTQRNRAGPALARLLERDDWHGRLVNGSDYPLPGVVPLIAVGRLADEGFLPASAVAPLRELRAHNPIAFDFVLKRTLAWRGRRFAPEVFATRRFFLGSA